MMTKQEKRDALRASCTDVLTGKIDPYSTTVLICMSETIALLDENETLRAGLEGIANDTHSDHGDAYHNATISAERAYQAGTIDGHRCAAAKARAALAAADAKESR